MEELTYEKLRAYAHLLPQEELNRWQPREAVKLLLALDPTADQSAKLEMSAEAVPDGCEPTEECLAQINWVSLGEHHSLSLKWLKNYHKVGQLLHAPKANESSVMTVAKQLKLLTEVLEELERAASSTIKSMVWQGGIGFDCEGCGRRLVASSMKLAQGSIVMCPNDNCQSEYALAKQEPDESSPAVISLAKSFQCPQCSGMTKIARRRLSVGYEFICSQCPTKFKLLEPKWQVAKV